MMAGSGFPVFSKLECAPDAVFERQRNRGGDK